MGIHFIAIAYISASRQGYTAKRTFTTIDCRTPVCTPVIRRYFGYQTVTVIYSIVVAPVVAAVLGCITG